MASSEIFFDQSTLQHVITIKLNMLADNLFIDSINAAFQAAGLKIAQEQGDKILAAISTENIERYIAEYVAKNLEVKLKEQTDAK